MQRFLQQLCINLINLDNSFELPVTYNGTDHLFPSILLTYGYSYKIAVTVFDTIINFEPDEEGNFRALVNPEEIKDNSAITKALLQLIAATLQEVLR